MSERIKEQLAIRHQERLDRFEARRLQRLKEKKETNESSDIFMRDFNKSKRDLLGILFGLTIDQPRTELTSEFDVVCQKLADLQKFVSDSANFLPSYDVRRAQEILLQIQDEITTQMAILLPKKKFAFKSRQKSKVKNDMQVVNSDVNKKDSITQYLNEFGFSNKVNETLTLMREEASDKDINISNLDNCTVIIHGYPSAVRMKNLINTTIKCGPVKRAIFISESYDCNFQLACQQLRIHSTSDAKFFIHVTSKAIIEDSENVGFGQYSFTYEDIDKDFAAASLNPDVNHWKEIDDFNWLKLDEQSPNWFLIDK